MIDREVKGFVLKALLARRAPFVEETLKSSIHTAFAPTALTNGDLAQWLRELEASGLIAGTADDLGGTVWDLTNKGKIKAQQL